MLELKITQSLMEVRYIEQATQPEPNQVYGLQARLQGTELGFHKTKKWYRCSRKMDLYVQ